MGDERKIKSVVATCRNPVVNGQIKEIFTESVLVISLDSPPKNPCQAEQGLRESWAIQVPGAKRTGSSRKRYVPTPASPFV